MRSVLLFGFFGIAFWGLGSFSVCAQSNWTLSPAFHASRRALVREQLPKQAVAVFFSAQTDDTKMPYVGERQKYDENFFYLTGYKGANAVLLIFKEAHRVQGTHLRELLVLPTPPKPIVEYFEGRVWRPEQAEKRLGIEAAYFEKDLKVDLNPFRSLWTTADSTHQWLKAHPHKGTFHSIKNVLIRMRERKTDEELRLIRRAVKITLAAHREAIRSLTPRISERALGGIHRFVYNHYGSVGPAFPLIIAAGENACTLHYRHLTAKPIQGPCLLMDTGAEVGGYAADVTRTYPVEKNFSKEAKALYALVLEAQTHLIKTCKAGRVWKEHRAVAKNRIAEGLIELGVLAPDEDPTQYIPHGVTHSVGLHVHDPMVSDTLRTSMVITIEPGVYIPFNSACEKRWWGIGIRIEDDILVQEDYCEVLSADLPKTISGIEALRAAPKGPLYEYTPASESGR